MRSRSRGSDMDEPSEETLMEAELARLQRSYRVMQNDYKAYKEETKKIINKQTSLIDSLEKEREELDTLLAKMDTTQNKVLDENNTKALQLLSNTEKEFQALVKEEKEQIKNLEQEIQKVEVEIKDQRKKMGGVHNSTVKHNAIHKKKAVLENRLDKSMVHFNKQLAINRELREDIDHLRRERAVFENLYKKLARELEQCKKEMTDVIETSTQAFEQRDEAQSKMSALAERSEKDQQQHDAEMKDLLRTISNDKKIKAFMNAKASDRAEYKTEEEAKKKRDEKSLDADQLIIQSYEEAFRRIQTVTGEVNIQTIVNNFMKNEEENFALFNYVNELNSEVETLQDEVATVKRDIEKFHSEDTQMDNTRKAIMKELEERWEKVHEESEQSESKLRLIHKNLEQLMSGIESLFKRVDCDPRPIREMLGGEAGITNSNVMRYLGQIEQRTTELISVLYYTRLRKSEVEGLPPPKLDALMPTHMPPIQHSVTQIVPPSTGDADMESEEETDDEELRPLTEQELRERVLRGIDRRTHRNQQKEGSGGAGTTGSGGGGGGGGGANTTGPANTGNKSARKAEKQ